jgi:hypothetical protein
VERCEGTGQSEEARCRLPGGGEDFPGANIISTYMDDVGSVKLMLANGVPRDLVLKSLLPFDPRGNRRPPQALTSWRDERFVRAVAEAHVQAIAMRLVPGAVATWSAAPEVRVQLPPRKPGARS